MNKFIAKLTPPLTLAVLALSAPQLEANDYEINFVPTKYKYKEPGLMELNGLNYRIGALGVFGTNQSDSVFRTEASFAYAKLDYTSQGTGKLNGTKNSIFDLRAYWQINFPTISNKSALYFGLGFRRLMHDLRGTTDTDHVGYRRLSRYLSLPVGWTTEFEFNGQWSWIINPEVALMFSGQQTTYLGDVDSALPKVNNDQSGGYHFRLKAPIKYENFAIGPFFEYWKIPDSEIVYLTSTIGLLEPKNYTLEYGIIASYSF
ncbi:hypothetical protein GW915_10260 [bacterium]|nr:hypothetical protein [bacterium]